MKKDIKNEYKSDWQDDYFDSIRSLGDDKVVDDPARKLRWGGTGKVEIIYYLADKRILNFVTFSWRLISNRGVTPPTSFRVNKSLNQSLLVLLPALERAQSTSREVFVDFFSDLAGGSAEVITIATL